MRIAVAGGVTGGHLYPNIAVLEQLQKEVPLDVLYFCVNDKLEEKVLPTLHPEYKLVSLKVQGLLRPIFHPENFVRFYKMITLTKFVESKLKEFKPDLIYVSGGYVSYPVARAGFKLGIPVYLQEQNVLPGKANLRISKFAKRIFVSFEESKEYFENKGKIIVTGNPVWEREGRTELEHPSVIVIGGSGGSEFLNDVAIKLSKEMPDVNFILSSGNKLSNFEVPPNLKIESYINNMYAYWRSADAAITRGGATTVSELLYYKVPAIVIPWEGSTESHQLLNAKIVEKKNLGYVVREKEFELEKVKNLLRELLKKGRSNEKIENPAKKIANILRGDLS